MANASGAAPTEPASLYGPEPAPPEVQRFQGKRQVGETEHADVKGFGPNEPIEVLVDGRQVALSRVDETGSGRIPFLIAGPGGAQRIEVRGVEKGSRRAAEYLFVRPRVTITPRMLRYGDAITVHLTGLYANDPLSIFIEGVTWPLELKPGSRLVSDDSGSASISFSVPFLPHGRHHLVIRSSYREDFTAEFTVEGAAVYF